MCLCRVYRGGCIIAPKTITLVYCVSGGVWGMCEECGGCVGARVGVGGY